MSLKETARYLKLSPVTLRKWRMEGRGIPSHKVEKRVLYIKEEVDDYLLKSKP